MARFARIDSQIRTNQAIRANRLRVPELNPPFCESAFRGTRTLRIAGLRRFARIARTFGFFFLSASRFIRANCPDLRCESPGHLSVCVWGLLRGGRGQHKTTSGHMETAAIAHMRLCHAANRLY